MSLALRFLGVGGAQSPELGSACGVLERAGEPLLMIDCGAEALSAYIERYGQTPRAVFVTHTHMDHVAGLERLFYKAWFDAELRQAPRLYAHANLVPLLQARVADFPEPLAEGGVNFWEGLHLLPFTRGFWHADLWFDVFATRHHAPGTSFGLALQGAFAWTGDTRPIPEMLATFAAGDALVAHDCGLRGNPSHSGVDDLEREYPAQLSRRLVLYHYANQAEAAAMTQAGWRVAGQGEAFALPAPNGRKASQWQ